MMDLVEVESQTMSLAAPPSAIRSPEGSWPTLSMSRREGVQLCNVATGRILEAPEYFRHGWMGIPITWLKHGETISTRA